MARVNTLGSGYLVRIQDPWGDRWVDGELVGQVAVGRVGDDLEQAFWFSSRCDAEVCASFVSRLEPDSSVSVVQVSKDYDLRVAYVVDWGKGGKPHKITVDKMARPAGPAPRRQSVPGSKEG